MLDALYIGLDWRFVIDDNSLNMLKAILLSWNTPASLHKLYLRTSGENINTRRRFLERLQKLGPILEEWICHSSIPSSVDSEVSQPRTQRMVCVELRDFDDWRDWWWTRLKGCFPTLVELDRLSMAFRGCKCSSDGFAWDCNVVSTDPLQFTSILHDMGGLGRTPTTAA